MKLGFQLLVCLQVLLIVHFTSFHVSCEKDNWTVNLFKVLYFRSHILRYTRQMEIKEQSNTPLNPDEHRTFLRHLRFVDTFLTQSIEDFALASFDITVKKSHYRYQIVDLLKNAQDIKALWVLQAPQLYSFQTWSRSLLDELENRMSKDLDFGSSQVSLDGICSNLHKPFPETVFTITDICSSSRQCATEPYPYGEVDEWDSPTAACTTDGKCNIEKALPMMAAVLYHSINNFIIRSICPKTFSLSDDDVNKAIVKLQHESRQFIAYAHIMPPHFDSFSTEFIKNAVESQGLLDLNIALQLVKSQEREFQVMPVACKEIHFPKACLFADIYTHYTLIEKIKKHRSDPGLVKDLRLNPKVKKQTMISLQKDSLQHLEILGSIKKLDENLEASVTGISSYFTELAKYDEGIADKDIIFIKGELKKYEDDLNDVQEKLVGDFDTLGTLTVTVTIANFVEEAATLAARIAENCNPLRVIFGGSAPGDIAEQMGKTADAQAKAVRGGALKIAAERLYSDSEQFNQAFFNGDESNKKQITSMTALVEKIRNPDQSGDIGADGADFIKEYGEYTPQTDRSSIAANNALWSAYKDAMCDLLNGEVGMAGAAPQSAASMLLVCESLDGTLAQFFTLRESIFDFQFQMIDALARIVRGNIAKRLAADIKGKRDVLGGGQLFLGFLMTHGRLQTHASAFCDILEYKKLGKPVDVCSSVLFSRNNLDALIAYKDTSPPTQVERDVLIPTKPRFQGDTGYIDLTALEQNGNVIFKIPVDSSWLQHYRWSLEGEKIPFVEDFKVYLPHTEYNSEQEHTTTRVTITSISGNAVSTVAPNTSPVYVLPLDHSTYVTVYEEGYPSCRSRYRIPNPYGLCNNLPDICDKSSRLVGDSLLPTILSSWKLKFTIQVGNRKLEWKAPKPSTNLMIRATLKLRIWPEGKRRSNLPRHLHRPKDEGRQTTMNLCCDNGNKYRDLLDVPRECKECPDYSTSKLRGLYCEIDTSGEKEEP